MVSNTITMGEILLTIKWIKKMRKKISEYERKKINKLIRNIIIGHYSA